MLTLLFNQAAAVANTGSITTDQPVQQDIASGAVVNPVVTVVGGGGGGGSLGGPAAGKIPAVTGVCRSEQREQQSSLNAKLEISGSAVTRQPAQRSIASGETRLTISGVCATAQQIQRPRLVGNLEIVGSAASAQPRQQSVADSVLEIRGVCGTSQHQQHSVLAGAAIARPVVPAVLEIVGVCGTAQTAQRSEAAANLECMGNARTAQATQSGALAGDAIDVELELIAAIILAAA